MIGSWYKKHRIFKKSQELLSSSKSIIRKNSDQLSPDILTSLKGQIENLELTLNEKDLVKIESSYKLLNNNYKENLSKFSKSKVRQNIEAIIIALCLAFLIRTFVVQPFKIPSGSMIPTLLIGDHLLVNKFVYGTKIPFTSGDKSFVSSLNDSLRADINPTTSGHLPKHHKAFTI